MGWLLRCRHAEAAEAVSEAVAAQAAVELGTGLQPAGAAMMEAFVSETVAGLLARRGSEDLIAHEVGAEELDAWLDDASGIVGVDLGVEQRATDRPDRSN